MVDKGDDEKFRGLENDQKFFSMSVVGLICMWVLLACISWESTLIFGNSEELQQSIEIMGESYKRGLLSSVRLLKQSLGEVDMCCLLVFMFY